MALGPVKPHVKAAADAIASQFGIKTMYGWRPSDPFPDHPSGLAVDFMINNLPNGKAVGDALADYVVKNGKALGVKYLIWYRRTFNIARGTWQPYTQAGQPPHTDHVHVTWNSTPGTGDVSVTPVGTVATGDSKIDQIYDVFIGLSKASEWVTDPKKRMRAQIFALGVAFIVFGLLKFDKVASVAGSIVGAATTRIKGVTKNGGQ